MEFIGVFHDLLALLKECVPLSTTSIVASNTHLSTCLFWFWRHLI
jgi:hypothetical protein